jgi:hypothetical protein
MKAFLQWLFSKGSMVDWTAIPDEWSDTVWTACRKGYVNSYVDTETYQLTKVGKDFLDKLNRRGDRMVVMD